MVKNIPDSLTFPFTVWMAENGFYPCTKKNFLVMKRGNEVAKISMVETEQGFAMNDICQKRFLSFCRAWLNRDKSYIDQLRMRGMAKMVNGHLTVNKKRIRRGEDDNGINRKRY